MGRLVDHDLTIEDLGAAIWALNVAPRFGVEFFWSEVAMATKRKRKRLDPRRTGRARR
jgi:hypothetical protein